MNRKVTETTGKQKTGQGRTGEDWGGLGRTGEDWGGQERKRKGRTGHDTAGQEGGTEAGLTLNRFTASSVGAMMTFSPFRKECGMFTVRLVTCF